MDFYNNTFAIVRNIKIITVALEFLFVDTLYNIVNVLDVIIHMYYIVQNESFDSL